MPEVFKVLREHKVNRALPVLMVHKVLPVHRDSKVFKVQPVRKVLPEVMVQKGRRGRRALVALRAQQVRRDLRGL
jgi:hypothetical protein